MSFFVTLKQRKIFQWAAAYLAGAWVLMQLIDVLGTRWGVSDGIARIIDIILIVGFFVTLVVAWYYGDQGRQRVSGPELLIIAALLADGGLVLGFLNFDQEELPRTEVTDKEPIISDEKPWIAVLPFKVQTADPELDPGYADAWTSLSLIYQQEFMNNLNPRPHSLQRGLETAQRAVDLDPTSSRAHFAMAQVHYFMRDVGAFLVHARRAIELNPRNTDTVAMVGIMMGYSAYWVALAISHAQLGDEAAAKHAAAELLRVWPDVERDYYQMGLVNWAYSQPELIEHVNEGLRKAGVNLQVPDVVKN